MSDSHAPKTPPLEQWFHADDHPTFFRSFSAEERAEMMGEDLVAGQSVPRLLTAIILIGVALATISVYFLS